MSEHKAPLVYSTANGFAESHHPYGSQVARPDGPILLQDNYLIESLAHFDRERVPERVVHAKGGGCRVEFELTESLSDITFAAPYQEVGYKCPGHARISTVGGESGSPDTARDPRGFSFKFQTKWGVHDWVFNNTPTFFIRDGHKFPHFIHTQKRDPATHLNAAEDSTMFWDFLTQNPETIHQITYMFGPRGTPASWADMNTYSGHTFKMINKKGELTYVRYHVLAKDGFKTLSSAEAAKLASERPDYNQAKLYDEIKNGRRPHFDCYLQTMTPKQAEEFRYSVNDLTKVWPHKDYPLRHFGKITMTENVENYFAEIEQLALSPSNTCIPGIEPSNDNMLQVRLFSYPDTQRYRLGVNYQQLPVNRPTNLNTNNEGLVCPYASAVSRKAAVAKCPYAATSFQRDGHAAFYNQGGLPNYISSQNVEKTQFKNLTDDTLTNRFQGLVVEEVSKEALEEQEKIRAQHEDFISGKINNYHYISGISPLDFEQPRALYENVFDDEQKAAFIENVVGHASKAAPAVQTKVTQYFGLLNKDLGEKLAKGLNIEWVPATFEEYAENIGLSSAY